MAPLSFSFLAPHSLSLSLSSGGDASRAQSKAPMTEEERCEKEVDCNAYANRLKKQIADTPVLDFQPSMGDGVS